MCYTPVFGRLGHVWSYVSILTEYVDYILLGEKIKGKMSVFKTILCSGGGGVSDS